MSERLNELLKSHLLCLEERNLYHRVATLEGPQGPRVRMDGRDIVMLSSNDYLGLACHPKVIEAAREAVERWGHGAASVRMICGTMEIHKELEDRLARLLGAEGALLYVSGNAANEGLISCIVGDEDALFSDELNHASVIDGIRLSKARRHVYAHGDMRALEKDLRDEQAARLKMIITDGLFCMEGHTAKLPEICDLAREHAAFVVVNDAHGVGVLGENGRGTPEEFGLEVDILTGELGNALGGACGGYVAAHGTVIEYLAQRSRPYMFASAVPPGVAAGALAAVGLVESEPGLRDALVKNTEYFRQRIAALGFEVLGDKGPIVPILVKEASLAHAMRAALFQEGVFVCGFGYPLVPKGRARLRAQISAAHTEADLDFAVEAFEGVGRELGVL